MAEYYLISQLPSLDGISENAPLPIKEEFFLELCNRFLGNKALKEVENLTLIPPTTPKKSSSDLINHWNDGERNLRLALAKARAEKMNKPYDLQNTPISSELLKTAGAALEFNSPLDAENFLLRYRLNFLETLRPMDNFSEDFIFYYGLKLKLLMRIRKFDTKLGEEAYKNIYKSILNGDRLEAIQ